MNETNFTRLPSIFSSMTGVPMPFLRSMCGRAISFLVSSRSEAALCSVAVFDSIFSSDFIAMLHRFLEIIWLLHQVS